MGVSHPIEVRNQLCSFLLDQLNEGPTPGVLEFQTKENKVVATLNFSNPAFLPPVDGVAIANPLTPDTKAMGGTITKAVFKNGNQKELFTCSVTAIDGGGEIELSTVRVPSGLEVQIPHLTYVAPL